MMNNYEQNVALNSRSRNSRRRFTRIYLIVLNASTFEIYPFTLFAIHTNILF